MLKITVIGSNGKAGQSYTAKDADHAQRIKDRIVKAQPSGGSISFKVKKV